MEEDNDSVKEKEFTRFGGLATAASGEGIGARFCMACKKKT